MPTIFDYRGSQKLSAEIYSLTAGNEFYTLFFSLLRVADSDNFSRLERAFPELVAEFRSRYNAPGGLLENEREIGRS
jgi:hypothetical protein